MIEARSTAQTESSFKRTKTGAEYFDELAKIIGERLEAHPDDVFDKRTREAITLPAIMVATTPRSERDELREAIDEFARTTTLPHHQGIVRLAISHAANYIARGGGLKPRVNLFYSSPRESRFTKYKPSKHRGPDKPGRFR